MICFHKNKELDFNYQQSIIFQFACQYLDTTIYNTKLNSGYY